MRGLQVWHLGEGRRGRQCQAGGGGGHPAGLHAAGERGS